MNRELAGRVVRGVLACSGYLDISTGFAQSALDHDSFVQYRRMVGQIMGMFYIEILRGIFDTYPDLESPAGEGSMVPSLRPPVPDALAAVRAAWVPVAELKAMLSSQPTKEQCLDTIERAEPLMQALLDFMLAQ